MTTKSQDPDNQKIMVRVLMLLEDYGEMIFLQTVLKKIGFDVDAHQNAHALPDLLLRFNPEILVMTAFGKRIPGADLSQSVKKVRQIPRVLLLHAPNQAPTEAPNVDRWLTSPIIAIKLVDAIAEVASLDGKVLQEKFNRIKLHEVEAETHQLIEGTADLEPAVPINQGPKIADSTLNVGQRQARFANALAAAATEPLPKSKGFSLADVKAQVKALRASEDPASTADLERERREFVSQLFRKK